MRIEGAGVGVDRLSISFPISEPDVDRFEQVTRRRAADGTESVSGGTLVEGVFVGAALIPEKGWMGKAEANPSRFEDPKGCTLLPVDAAGEAAERLWSVAGRVVDPRTDLGHARVKRVDLARDFRGCADPGFLIRGLSGRRRKYARRQFVYNDPQRGAAETLFVGSKAGGVRLYDQHQAYADKGAPAGSIRWEVEARSAWLMANGLGTVADLGSAEALRSYAGDRWEWSEMGATVSGAVSLVDQVAGIVAAGSISPAKGASLLGFLLLEASGRSLGEHQATTYRQRALAREHGLYLDPEALQEGLNARANVTKRLDWSSGSEVSVA